MSLTARTHYRVHRRGACYLIDVQYPEMYSKYHNHQVQVQVLSSQVQVQVQLLYPQLLLGL